MRILMVNRFFYPFLGGVEFHVQNLGVELTKLGCMVTIACRRDAALPASETFRNLEIRRIESASALRRLAREGFQVVHAHMPRNAFTVAGLYYAKRAGIPAVLTPHCFYPSPGWVWRGLKAAYDATVLRYTFSLADRVINLTESDRADAIARGLSPAKSCIIPNSVRASELAAAPAVDFRAKYQIPSAFLLHIGRFDQVKNVEFLVRAHRGVEALGLVLIGQDGGRLAAVRSVIRALGLEDRVRIIERAPFSDICGAYQQARALVLASTYEGLPTVILEALFFGCPVVASGVGGVTEVLSDSALGLTYPLLDERAYVAAVAQATGRRRGTQLAGRRLVEREYAWEVNAPRVLALYRELQGARATPAVAA